MKVAAVAASLAVVLSVAPVFAQAAGQAPRPAPAPATPAAAQPATPPPPPPFPAGAKIGFVNLQQVANLSGEGKISTGKVQALMAKKQTEAQTKSKALADAQAKLASSLGFNRGRFFVQPSLFLTKPRVLLFEGGDTRFFDVCLLPGTHRDEESFLANQRVRRQHDRHEQERRVQQPPATRGWRHRGWFPPAERFGSRLSAGCRHNGRTHDWRRHWLGGVLCTILFESRLRGN